MNIASIIESYITSYNQFNVDEMLSFFQPNCIFENLSNSAENIQIVGIETLRNFAEMGIDIFKERKQEVLKLNIGTNHAVVEIRFEGVLKEENKKVQIRGVSIFEFENGKISRLADYS